MPPALLILLAAAGDLLAQAGPGAQTLRPYWHVFIAYAAAWLLVLGWVISIARRLGRLEQASEE